MAFGYTVSKKKQTKNPSLKSLPISPEKCFNVGKLLVVDTGFPEFWFMLVYSNLSPETKPII